MAKKTDLLQALRDADSFVSTAPHKRDVKIGKNTVTVYVREPMDSDTLGFIASFSKSPADLSAERIKIVAKCIVDEDGNPIMTLEQAALLKPRMLTALVSAINSVGAETKEDAESLGESLTSDQTNTSGT